MVDMKAEINQMEEMASLHEVKRLVADEPRRMETYSLEVDVLKYLKRVYYFSKRMARGVLVATGQTGNSRRWDPGRRILGRRTPAGRLRASSGPGADPLPEPPARAGRAACLDPALLPPKRPSPEVFSLGPAPHGGSARGRSVLPIA